MLPYEVIKYNVGEYLNFEMLDKLGEDIFQHYVEGNPIEAADYLCSIRDEQRLIEVLKQYKIDVSDYYMHCWDVSGANVGFMSELFGYHQLASYPSNREPLGHRPLDNNNEIDNKLIDVIIDFLNLDLSTTLTRLQIDYLTRLLPDKPMQTPYRDYLYRLLPFIQNHMECNKETADFFYSFLDSDDKLQMIKNLKDRNIKFLNMIEFLNREELASFIENSESFSKDVAVVCLSKISPRNSNPWEVLLNPEEHPIYEQIKMMRKKISDNQDDEYCIWRPPIRPQYDMACVKLT